MLENYKIVKRLYFVYMVILLGFALLFPSKNPTWWHLSFQVFQATAIYVLAYFLFQKDRGVLYFAIGIAIYLVINISAYKLFNYYMLGNWIGLPGDGYSYNRIASSFANGRYSVFDLLDYFKARHIMLDDYGMFGFTSLLYWFFGCEWGIHILPFCNIFPILIGGYVLKKLALHIGLDSQCSYLLFFLWSTMTFACFDSSVALKENYMVCMVLLSTYYLLQITSEITLLRCVLFLLCASSLLLFRTAVFYVFLICLITAIMLKVDFFGRHLWLWLSVFFIISVFAFSFAIDYIGGIRGGVSSSVLSSAYNDKMAEAGVFGPILNVVSALIGPIPSFLGNDEHKLKYMTLFSFTSTIKILFSFGYVYTLCYVIRNRVLDLLPILIFIIFNSLMLIVCFYTLHDRYQWPQYPLVLLLSFYGIDKYYQSNPYGNKYKYYCYLAVLIIVIFNLRVI